MTDEQHKPVRQEVGPVEETDQYLKDIEVVRATATATAKPHAERMKAGLERVAALIAAAKSGLHANDPLEKNAQDDILRAAVVLLHAHLEDHLRSVASALLLTGDENCLNAIPLAGVSGRPEKFLLGRLVQHKGKLVDDLLRESVSEYLERRTFSDTDEIAQTLEALGVDISKVSSTFPEIQRMMERRHQIVHRADRIREDDPTVLAAISPDEVEVWMKATKIFLQSMLLQLGPKLIIEFTKTPKMKRVRDAVFGGQAGSK